MKKLLLASIATLALQYTSGIAQAEVPEEKVYDLLLKPCVTQALSENSAHSPSNEEVQAVFDAQRDLMTSITELIQTLGAGLDHSAQGKLLGNYFDICVHRIQSSFSSAEQ